MRQSTKLQIYIMLIIISSILVIVPTVGYLVNKQAELRNNIITSSSIDIRNKITSATFNGISVNLTFTEIHPETLTFNALVEILPFGNWTNDGYTFVQRQLISIISGAPGVSKYLTLEVSRNSGSMYPLDIFLNTVQIFAHSIMPNYTLSIPIALQSIGVYQSWNIATKISKETSKVIGLDVEFKRSGGTIFFSICVNATMWLLSLSILTLSVTLWIRKRKVEPPTLGVAAGLLFALPALRNLQPGIGVIGSPLDAIGFLWNMLLISVSLLLLMWNYIFRYTKDKVYTTQDKQMSFDFGYNSEKQDYKNSNKISTVE